MKMKKRFIATFLSLCMVFQCILVLPTVSYASYLTDTNGVEYEIDSLFEYEFSNEAPYSCVITKYKQSDNPDIVQIKIPKEIYGVKVVEIGKQAFKNAIYLEQIHIPDSINKIEEQAFYNVESLKSITIPGSVQTIGKQAFATCKSLEEAYILYGVRTLGVGAFMYCSSLRTISSGSTVESSGKSDFRGTKNLTIQSNPNAPILKYADSKITKVELPDDSPAAYEYFVNENDEVVISRYQSDRKNPIIPDEINGNPVVRLAEGSFKDSGIDSVTLPDTLRTIDSNVFIGTNITEITIPPNVTSLGQNFIENKTGLIINGSSKVVEEYTNKNGLKFKAYDPGTSNYYNLEVKINGYGSITGTKGGYIKSGKAIKIYATPYSKYEFENWTCEGGGIVENAKNSNTTFYMPSSNATLIANFKKKPKERLVIENGIVTEFNAYDDLVIPQFYEGKEVTGIASNAFGSVYDHGNPSSLTIPSSLVDIPINALNNCPNLKYIKVNSGNLVYKDIDGVLFSADGKTLIKYPAQKDSTEYIVPDGVTTIEESAFKNCGKLTKVNIPNSVNSIKSYAFYYCSNLSEINIPDGVKSIESYAFYECYNLKSIVLPNGLTSINNYAFAYSGLSSIDIPSTVTDIGYYAFAYCNNLTQINVKANISLIGNQAFHGCSNLTSINVDKSNSKYIDDNGVLYEKMGNAGFKLLSYPQAKEGTSYTIRTDTVEIESYAFYNCDKLTQIDLNTSSLTTIGSCAFYDCDSITSIDIPQNVSNIGSQAFYSCDKLENINVDENNKAYTSNNEGILFNYNKTTLIVYPVAKGETKYSIPESVNKIEIYAFSNARNLVNVDIPNDLSYIGSWAFSSCTNLESLVFPEKVSNISDYVVNGCSNLKTITIYNKNANIDYGYNHTYEYEYDYSFSGIDKSKVTMIGYLDSTAEAYALLNNMKFEQIDKVSEGLLVDEKGILYGYEGTDLDVVLSSNIKQIGHDAFKNPNNTDSTIYSQITSIKFPLSVKSFEPYAFDGCTSLTSLDVTRAVYDIQKGAFDGCSNLVEFNVDENNTTYKSIGGKDGKDNGVLVNHSSTIIKEVANGYKGPEGDGKYTIPSDITGIEDGAFNNCSLIEITMGNIEYIGANSFEGAFKNADIKLNLTNVVDINDRAFANCTGITEVNLPATLERLGSDVFDGCTSLKNIFVEKGDSPFFDNEGVLYRYTELSNESDNIEFKPVELILYPIGRTDTTYTILEGTIGIADCAFNGAKNLESIDIPETVLYIGERAFDGCTGLEELTLKDGLKEIKAFAFTGNELLREVSIPKTVQKIDVGAFTNCSKLYSVTILNDNLEFATEGKIFDEEENDQGNCRITLYASEGSTTQEYVKGRKLCFGVLNTKGKETITLNATGNKDKLATLTSAKAETVIKNVYSKSINEVEIKVDTVLNNVYSITTSLPKSFIENLSLVVNKEFTLTINTPIARLSLDQKAIVNIANKTTDDIQIIIKNIDTTPLAISSEYASNDSVVQLSMISGNKEIDLNNGYAKISIYTNDKN